jgi:hypothetical protein
MAQRKKSVTKELQLQSRQGFPQLFEKRRRHLQAAQGTGGAYPDQLDCRTHPGRGGYRVKPRIHTRWNEIHRGRIHPAGYGRAEEFVADDDPIANANRCLEAPKPAGIVQALWGKGIPKEKGIVHVEEQPPSCSAKRGKLPARQQATLQEDILTFQTPE